MYESAKRPTVLASDIPLVEFDFACNQELDEFIPKTDLLMRRFLTSDVLPDFWYIRLTDREGSITSLPDKILEPGRNSVHPAAGIRF